MRVAFYSPMKPPDHPVPSGDRRMALLEAQAAGLPVVAGRTGGVPDIVRDGTTGLLTPPGDAAAFAGAVAALLDGPARRTAMGAAAAFGERYAIRPWCAVVHVDD